MKYCSNCKKETPHEDATKIGHVNKSYKCTKCGYYRVEAQGFNYDLM